MGGDEIRIYYAGMESAFSPNPMPPLSHPKMRNTRAVGLATLRLDGFVSLDAGDGGGELTTEPFRFQEERIIVNADASGGSRTVEARGVKPNSAPSRG